MYYPTQYYDQIGRGYYPPPQNPSYVQQQQMAQPVFGQQRQQPQQNNMPMVVFAGEQEARGYLPSPNSCYLFIDQSQGRAYLKGAADNGQIYLSAYSFAPCGGGREKQSNASSAVNTSEKYITAEDLQKMEENIVNRFESIIKKMGGEKDGAADRSDVTE